MLIILLALLAGLGADHWISQVTYERKSLDEPGVFSCASSMPIRWDYVTWPKDYEPLPEEEEIIATKQGKRIFNISIIFPEHVEIARLTCIQKEKDGDYLKQVSVEAEKLRIQKENDLLKHSRRKQLYQLLIVGVLSLLILISTAVGLYFTNIQRRYTPPNNIENISLSLRSPDLDDPEDHIYEEIE